MKKRVSITEEDVALGIPAHSAKCALARALRRVFPTLEPVVLHISKDDAYFIFLYEVDEYIMGHRRAQPIRRLRGIWRLSKNGGKWIHTFDYSGTGEPATFEMTFVGGDSRAWVDEQNVHEFASG